MSNLLLLEEKHRLLKNGLDSDLERKRSIEMRITKQFEELKRVEVSLEKIRARCEKNIKTNRMYEHIDLRKDVILSAIE
jgi:hypothetical protein